MAQSPCYACPKRHKGCHEKCYDYQKFKKAKEKESEKRQKLGVYTGYVRESVEKKRRK